MSVIKQMCQKYLYIVLLIIIVIIIMEILLVERHLLESNDYF